MSLKDKIRDWYMDKFPDDVCGEDINKDVQFIDVVEALCLGKDVYAIIGEGDSLTRERIFDKIVELLNRLGYKVDYECIYNSWLDKAPIKLI